MNVTPLAAIAGPSGSQGTSANSLSAGADASGAPEGFSRLMTRLSGMDKVRDDDASGADSATVGNASLLLLLQGKTDDTGNAATGDTSLALFLQGEADDALPANIAALLDDGIGPLDSLALARLLVETARHQARKQHQSASGEDGELLDDAALLAALTPPVEIKDIAGLASGDTSTAAGTRQNFAAFLAAGRHLASDAEEDEADPASLLAVGKKWQALAANLAGKAGGSDSLPDKILARENAADTRDFSQFIREAGTLPSRTSAGAASAATVNTPVTSPAWGERLGEQIIWMNRHGQQQIDLKLTPAHLGPLSISLQLDGEKATLNFTAITLEVRQAIEDAMPRLREMLAAIGVDLDKANVGEDPQRHRSSGNTDQHAQQHEAASNDEATSQHQNGTQREQPGENSTRVQGNTHNGAVSPSILADTIEYTLAGRHPWLADTRLTGSGLAGIDLFA
jgi:flagellar hook-length control protein FliK